MSQNERTPSKKLLQRLADKLYGALRGEWETGIDGRESHRPEWARALRGPTHRAMEAVGHTVREGVPGWREPALPGLEPSREEQDYIRTHAQMNNDEQRRREMSDRAGTSTAPITRREHFSIWAGDMREAEKAALQVAATENAHDHAQGRER